jgi:hypothetical protein
MAGPWFPAGRGRAWSRQRRWEQILRHDGPGGAQSSGAPISAAAGSGITPRVVDVTAARPHWRDGRRLGGSGANDAGFGDKRDRRLDGGQRKCGPRPDGGGLGRPGRRGSVVEQAVAAAEAAEIVFELRGSAGLRAPVHHRHAVHGFAAERQDVRQSPPLAWGGVLAATVTSTRAAIAGRQVSISPDDDRFGGAMAGPWFPGWPRGGCGSRQRRWKPILRHGGPGGAQIPRAPISAAVFSAITPRAVDATAARTHGRAGWLLDGAGASDAGFGDEHDRRPDGGKR